MGLFIRSSRKRIKGIEVPPALAGAVGTMNTGLADGSCGDFVYGAKRLVEDANSQGMTFQDIRPIVDSYLDRLLAEEKVMHERYCKPGEEFHLSSISATIIDYTETVEYPVERIYAKNSRIVDARFRDLQKEDNLGFDVVGTAEDFDGIYRAVQSKGLVVRALDNARYYGCMENPPMDLSSSGREEIAIRVGNPSEPLPKDGTQEKREGFYVAPSKGAWNLFKARIMSLRVNDRSFKSTVHAYNALQRYKEFFEKQ